MENHSQNIIRTSDEFTLYARKRAWMVAVGFALWGLALAVMPQTEWQQSWPLIVFYAALILNSFFSVRVFASITPPRHIGQQFFDILLGLCLAFLPLNFGSPLNFILLATILFTIAALKYIFLIPLIGFSQLLYKKIRIDSLGILLCLLALTGFLWGYAKLSSVLFALIFLLANAHVLWLRPLYLLKTRHE
ncbi:MAG: hypothetical protein Q8Q46_01655 [Candidatus Giovannonibacteria bacterium]|nr:hypothetical protein [Candidatus Giovannonibacteria bacterium]